MSMQRMLALPSGAIPMPSAPYSDLFGPLPMLPAAAQMLALPPGAPSSAIAAGPYPMLALPYKTGMTDYTQWPPGWQPGYYGAGPDVTRAPYTTGSQMAPMLALPGPSGDAGGVGGGAANAAAVVAGGGIGGAAGTMKFRDMYALRSSFMMATMAGGAMMMLSKSESDVARGAEAADAKLRAMMERRSEGGRVDEMRQFATQMAAFGGLAQDIPVKNAISGMVGFGMTANQIKEVMPGLIGQSRLYGHAANHLQTPFIRYFHHFFSFVFVHPRP